LQLCQEHDDHVGIAVSEHNLARVALGEGDLQRAADLFLQSLNTFQAEGHRHGLTDCLLGLAGVAAMGGRPEQAARLFGAGMANRDHDGLPLSPVKRAEAERDLAVVKRTLDPTAFAAAWQNGQALTLEQAIEEARTIDLVGISSGSQFAARAPSPASPLTRREEEVARLIVHGRSNRQIADELFISERTADSHVSHILTKLGFTSRAQIAAWAVEHLHDSRHDHHVTDLNAETLWTTPHRKSVS
jgi:non-specific serine/threonine protein kinase